MKKLLVLGASIAQIPFIRTAKSLGCRVAVVDYNNNAAAIEFADEYFECSLLDVDGVRTFVRQFQPDGISCGASDVGVMTAAVLCQELQLPGIPVEVAHRVKDKSAMIEAFRKCNVAHPEYQIVENVNDRITLDFPIVTKPTDNSGSRGISVARNESELKTALQESFSCSYSHRVIVEEYMDGPEVSVEILVQNREPHIIQVTDKLTTGEPHFIELGHSQPSQLPKENITAIKCLAYDAVKAVGVIDGCCHAEIKLTSQGPKMVEIAGRLGGDFITTVLAPISTGVNMAEYEVFRAIGSPKVYTAPDYTGRGVAVRFIEAKPGMVKSVGIDYNAEDMTGLEEMKFVCESGVMYSNAENNNDRFGYVIATGKTAAIAVERCEKIIHRIKIEMN